MSLIDGIDLIREDIGSHGWDPGPIRTNGRYNRFDTGKRGDKCGWYICSSIGDFVVATYGCNREGSKYTISNRNGNRTREEAVFFQKHVESAEAQKQKVSKKAQKRAQFIWDKAQPADPTHPYLLKKGILPNGVKQYKGALIISVNGKDGHIVSIQFIAGDGSKRFLKGGKVDGGSWVIPGTNLKVLVEGFATGASIAEATGATVKIAFNAGNLLKVAERGWIIAGDNDAYTTNQHGDPWNPGREKMLAAGWEHNCLITMPAFPPGIGTKPTDFNDLAKIAGLDAVKDQIGDAVYPQEFLLGELQTDPGACYRKEHIAGLNAFMQRDKAAYMALRSKLKKLKIGVTELEKDIRGSGKISRGATDHLSLAREVVAGYGAENVIHTAAAFTWQ